MFLPVLPVAVAFVEVVAVVEVVPIVVAVVEVVPIIAVVVVVLTFVAAVILSNICSLILTLIWPQLVRPNFLSSAGKLNSRSKNRFFFNLFGAPLLYLRRMIFFSWPEFG